MKDKLTLKNLMYALSVVLGIVTILLMFGDWAVYNGVAKGSYTGVQATFGYSESTLLGNVEVLNFSFMNLLPFLLVLACVVLALLKFLGVVKSKIVDIVMIVLFAVSAVLFFCASNFVVFASEYANLELKLGAGAIVAGIMSILSAGVVVLPAFVLKGKK